MDALTRRRFLLASGVVGASGLAATGGTLWLADLFQSALKAPIVEQRDEGVTKLVLVTLYGGNDGLNTVIPYTDSAYYSARPELSYAAEKVLRLNESFGLNPVMKRLKGLWDQKRLAVVLGVGYPKPDHSHFRSMDIWQTASPKSAVRTGWVGRWLDGTKAPVEAAVSFEPVLPPLFAGETRAGACVTLDGLQLPAGIKAEMLAGLGKSEPNEPAMQAMAALAYRDMLKFDVMIREARSKSDPAATDGPANSATSTGGASSLAAQLTLVAKCIEAGVPTRVYSVSLGGFDTHADELAGQETQLKRLDSALSDFVVRISKTVAGRQTAVVVYSEFGRRVRANASDGTDHGTAGPVLVLGHRVRGGFYGEQPSLTDLDDGDLKMMVDFRDVYGTILASVLKAEPERYLDGYKVRPLPLFESA